MIEGVNQVLLEVEDQDRALEFWTESIGFELAQDARYGEGTPWLEVRTRDKAVTLVLSRRRGKRPTKAAERPASYIFLYCDDLPVNLRGAARPRRRFLPSPRRAGQGLVVDVRRSRGQPLRTRSARSGVRSGTKGEQR